MPNFGSFSLSSIIMHLVPPGRPTPISGTEVQDPITYSETPTQLSTTDRNFIDVRLRRTLAGYARPVLEQIKHQSDVPLAVKSLLDEGESELVRSSILISRRLYQSQAHSSPGGLVATALGSVDGATCALITKMEHQEGMRMQETEKEGLRTYQAEYLKDLILSEGTRIFKTGVFLGPDNPKDAPLSGHVVDDQFGQGSVAQYFIDFMGCAFTRRPDVLTSDFFQQTQKFVKSNTAHDPEASVRYEMALLTEMNSLNKTIRPTNFAMANLNAPLRDAYIAQIQQANIPVTQFTKDVSLVTSSIRRVRISTDRGADVIAPPDMFEDGSVEVERDGDAIAKIIVSDSIRKIDGAGGGRRQ